MKKMMAIFAHPDDEGAIGGSLAHYAAQADCDVMLVCATRGEVGEISDPSLATPEILGEVRQQELEAACAALGVQHLRFLDYRDSGMEGTPPNEDPRALIQADPTEAVGKIVHLIREYQPDIVITFEPYGWYGHPDHKIISQWATAAYFQAVDKDTEDLLGPVWQPAKLYHAVVPMTQFKTVVNYAIKNGLLEETWAGFGTDEAIAMATEAQVTHKLDVRAYGDKRQMATAAHATQFGEDHFFRRIPVDMLNEVTGYDYFIQVWPEPEEAWRAEALSDLFD
ncbi:MAG TPA: PIG-L family deacetylase [Anaerolineae bacterium]|nr:PIG-L family deacetylase [Anaerolineae bacterium]